MKSAAKHRARRIEPLPFILLVALALGASGCADRPAPGAMAPRANEPPYPVLMTATAERREAALAAWTIFAHEQGLNNPIAPELQPITATIRALPAMGTPIYLPKLGDHDPMTEEETRDSLRRFLTNIRALLGAEPQQLSLVQRTDLADGTKKARYEQRPFRYPLRGDYGVVEITFTPDRRVLQISSTAIPEVELLQRAGAGIRARWLAEAVPQQLAGRTYTYLDESGIKQALTVAKGEAISVRELVIYPVTRATDPAVLEFHLAWEIAIGPAQGQRILYFDAVTDELLAVTQATQ